MFDSTYPVVKVNRQAAQSQEFHNETIMYRFDTLGGERYLIFVTYYPARFFTVDFCRRVSRNSRNKWTELVNSGDGIKVLSTVVHWMIRLLLVNYNEGFSCGFIGAPMTGESSERGSKRFQVYRRIMLNLIDRNKFIHLEDRNASAYLIVHPQADIREVVNVARQVFDKEEEE